MKLQESGEMYLETILILSEKKNIVRSVDISDYMGFSKPSVSRAVGLLREGGFITVGAGGAIELTEAGHEIADVIYERHVVLTDLLIKLGVSPDTAADDACKIEHDISAETFQAIKEYVAKVKRHIRESEKK